MSAPGVINEFTNFRRGCGVLYKHLERLDEHLDKEFLIGQIFLEADVVSSTVQYLRNCLTNNYEFWCIGTQHPIVKKVPDIVCYYSETPTIPDDFHRNRLEYVVCIIEVKFANQGDDLTKLTDMQSYLSGSSDEMVLAWRIFGDHFNSQIHQKNSEQHKQLEAEMQKWRDNNPQRRGFTVMKCGDDSNTISMMAKERRQELNMKFWILDRKSPYRK